jgi:hypothetical protein
MCVVVGKIDSECWVVLKGINTMERGIHHEVSGPIIRLTRPALMSAVLSTWSASVTSFIT